MARLVLFTITMVAMAATATAWFHEGSVPNKFIADGGCRADQFQCKDGSGCIPAMSRCTTGCECGDCSDESEEVCDAFPKTTLPPNATVRASVQYKDVSYSGITVHLCGGEHCSRVWLHDIFSDGMLEFTTFTRCNLLGACPFCETYSYNFNNTARKKDFTLGEVVLEVQHQPGQPGWLAVWREGRPDDVVEVPVDQEGDYGTLRVRPLFYSSDMTVDFTDSTEKPSTTEAATTTEKSSSTASDTPPDKQPTPTSTQAATTEESSSTSSSSAGTTGTEPEPASSTAASWPPIPAPTSCTPDKLSLLIPVAGDCNKYVVCYSGRAQEMPCPGVLVFNYQLQTCDWPANVACSP